MFGNENLQSPAYDIAVFADKIPLTVPMVNHGEIKILLTSEDAISEESSIFDNVYFVWLVTGVVGIVLGMFSVKMIKEIGK